MQVEKTLKLSSVAFAAILMALMWRWSAGFETVPVVFLGFCGGLAGLLWYWLNGKWFRWYFGRR
jgi:hypothetical protein